MEKYLGVKLIEAELMTLDKYNSQEGIKEIKSATTGNEGYKVVYEDGYESWSPRNVFEKAYRKIKTLNVTLKEGLPYQIRVIEEAQELNTKTQDLANFIGNSAAPFTTLSIAEQSRLKQQLLAMQYYLTILVERIENFN